MARRTDCLDTVRFMGKEIKHKIKFRNHLVVIQGSIWVTIMILIVAFFTGQFKTGFDEGFLKVFAIFYLILVVPAILLHIEYFLVNKNDTVVVDCENRLLTINSERFAFDKIKEIEIHMTPTTYAGRNVKFLAVDEYSYAKIFLANGRVFYFTCLLSTDVEKVVRQIREVNIVRKQRFLPSKALEMLGLSEMFFD